MTSNSIGLMGEQGETDSEASVREGTALHTPYDLL